MIQALSLLLFLLICGPGSCSPNPGAPQFFPALTSTDEFQDSHWLPPTDSLDCILIDLCGAWEWNTPSGQSGRCRIPSCYIWEREELVFHREFRLPPGLETRDLRLWFGGVAYSCRVLVNEQFIASHAGSGIPFEVQIPGNALLPGGLNRLEVAVDSRLSVRSTIPLKTQAWDPLHYGGIHREVFLKAGPRLRIEDLKWRLSEERRGEALVLEVRIHNGEELEIGADSLAVEALWLKGELQEESGESLGEGRAEFEIRRLESQLVELKLKLPRLPRWRPEDPRLYRLELELGRDTSLLHRRRLRLGFPEPRNFGAPDWRQKDLRGISYVPDHPELGIALGPREIEQDLENIRNLGANLVLHLRGSAHPYLAELCDRAGLLLIEELPLWNTPPKLLKREELHLAARDRLLEMAQRGAVHPSLLALSAGSGLDLSDPLTGEYLEAIGAFREVERGIPLAAGGFFVRKEAAAGLETLDLLLLERFDPRAELPPAQGPPILLSRIGFPVEIGNLKGYANPYSEIHQARRIQQDLLAAGTLKSGGGDAAAVPVLGTIVHSYCDWRGGQALLWAPPGQDPGLCPLGVHDHRRRARSAAKALAGVYGGQNPAGLTRGEYEPRHPPAYPLAGFGLLILLLVGYKQNNVFSQNLKRSFVHSHGFFADINDNRIYQFGQALFLCVLVSGASSLILSGLLHYYRKSIFFDHLLNQLIVFPQVKEWVLRISWKPLESMAQLSLLVVGLFVFSAVGLRILGLLFNARFSLRQSMTFLCWSSASLLLLIPVGTLFYRLLQIRGAGWPTAIVLLLLLAWFLQRLVKSLRIAFERSFGAVFLLLVVLGLVIAGLVLAYYENAHCLFEYLEYYRRIY